MTEQDINLFYALMIIIVAIVYGIAIAIFVKLHDGESAAEASFAGGMFGAACGFFWPATLLATCIALVAMVILSAASFVWRLIRPRSE